MGYKVTLAYDLCQNCGHYYFLHSALNGECEACDSPEVKIEDKCEGFKECLL